MSLRKPRVLFLSADTSGCGFWRMYMPAFWLHAGGFAETRLSNATLRDQDISWADAVIFQRYRNPVDSVWWEFHKRGTAILTENDDRYDKVPPHSCWKKPFPQDEVAAIQRSVTLCDAALTTTPELAEHWRRFNEHVYVLPNSVDLRVEPVRKPGDQFALKPEYPDDGLVRIGWMASPHHAVDWGVCRHALKDVCERHPRVALSFFGWLPSDAKQLTRGRIEHRPWVKIKEYFATLRSMRWDIGIAPLIQCEFNDAKSELKAVEYGMLGIPCVATPAAPYRRIVERGAPHVLLAESHKQWVEHLDTLVTDREFRRGLGVKGREFVEDNYDIRVNVQAWHSAICETIERPRNPKRAEAFGNLKAVMV